MVLIWKTAATWTEQADDTSQNRCRSSETVLLVISWFILRLIEFVEPD
jgi:hypothetical protein